MTTVVNFKTDKKIKTEAQKIAEKMGLNLSDVLNIYLRRFVMGKRIYINLNEDESNPSDKLLEAVKEAKEELKNKSYNSFKSAKEAIKYLGKFID